MKLGEMVNIRTGLILSRKKSNVQTKHRYRLLNLKSIDPQGYINKEELDVFDAKDQLSSEYLTKTNDIIIRLSQPYTAVLIDKETEKMVISSNFLIIRNSSKNLMPAYLLWFLNTEKVKRNAYKSATSNMLSAITPQYYNELSIIIPPMEKQSAIANLFTLSQREQILLEQLKNEKQKLNQIQTYKIQKEISKGNTK